MPVGVVDLLLPASCPACGAPGPVPCGPCAASLAPAGQVPVPPGLDTCTALFRHEGTGRRLVAGLKFRGRHGGIGRLAEALASSLPSAARRPGVTVTWAPTTSSRRRDRGYDQAEVLARAVARALDLPVRATLSRAAGPAQTGRGGVGRAGVTPFVARRRPAAEVLVVDDVLTTGATLTAAAGALRAAGAVAVHGVVLAHTPRLLPRSS